MDVNSGCKAKLISDPSINLGPWLLMISSSIALFMGDAAPLRLTIRGGELYVPAVKRIDGVRDPIPHHLKDILQSLLALCTQRGD